MDPSEDSRMGTKAAEYVSRTSIGAYFHSARESRKLVLVIVAIALLLDNMLLTTVVPIIPEFLYHVRHRNDILSTTVQPRTTSTTVNMMDWSDYDNMTNSDMEEIMTSTVTSTTLSAKDM